MAPSGNRHPGATARRLIIAAAGACVQAAAKPTTTVLLLRHCPRSPYASDRHPPAAPNNYTFADNYSAQAFPSYSDWGVKQGACTAQGLEAAAELGAALRPILLGPSNGKLRVVADSVDRCVATAAALGLNSSAVEVNQVLFDPLSAHYASCPQPDWDGVLQKQLAASTSDFARERVKLPALQQVLGRGVAPALSEIPDTVTGGYLVGGMRVASELIVETFILEKASKLPVAWGKMCSKGLRNFQSVHTTYFKAMYGPKEIAQRYGSGTLATLTKAFTPSEPSVTVLAGHDTTTIAVGTLLGLTWQCGPWIEGATTPLSGFLFTLDIDAAEVSVKAVCHTFDKNAEPLAMSTARFPDGKETMPLADFTALANAATLSECVNSTAFDSQSFLV